ncbi:hypothetical protein LOTGIDRAFT_156102 [Lottia gigantea]|uniref:Uncharacterized protein n=1 Tax=Lottia gigantea TaxID=225164 RepID=V4BGB8_LOTGI|nr:hypothetical protein LOTGIDRAFT_156102 [Lottia gigantea]ESP04862.1 hypothetical protein LOTGIDRAFT_156102 [Lottia gigantea]
MRNLVLMIAIALASTVNAQDRFLYGALPTYNQPGPSSFYFDNGYSPSSSNTYQQPFGSNRFPSTPDVSSPSFDYGSSVYTSNTLLSPFASINSPQSNAFTSFPQTIGLSPFGFPQQPASIGYQQPIRPFEGFGQFGGNQQFSSYVSPFSGFPQNNQGFGVNQGPVAPPQFLFPTASNQPFGPSPFRNTPAQVNQLPPQQSFQNTNPFTQPQLQTQQQSQFPTNNPFQQPQPQTGFPSQPTQPGLSTSPPSQGNQLRPIKGIFGPGQPGQFDTPKEYVIPL